MGTLISSSWDLADGSLMMDIDGSSQDLLLRLGFTDPEKNRAAIDHAAGDFKAAVIELLDQTNSDQADDSGLLGAASQGVASALGFVSSAVSPWLSSDTNTVPPPLSAPPETSASPEPLERNLGHGAMANS